MQSLKRMAADVVMYSSRKELGMREDEKLSDRIPHHLAEELMVGLKTVWPLSGRVLMMTVVRHGRLAIVKRLMLVEEYRKMVMSSAEYIYAAVKGGHLGIVRYLRESGAPIDAWAIARAAQKGHVAILKYVQESMADDEWASLGAAQKGHVAILKYVPESMADDEWASLGAKWDGHLEVVRYLLESGSPIDKRAIAQAAREGHLEVVRYLLAPE